MTKSIVFIDSRVVNYQTLIDSLSEPAQVFILDGATDGLAQLAADLQGQTGIDAIHIISHGSQGGLYLGSTVLDSGNLAAYGSQLASIGSALTQTGDILLYGCNVAQGDVGLQFISSLAKYTGADVAASSDATGAATLGGDWVLEQATGQVETSTVNGSDIYTTLLAGNTAPTFVLSNGTLITEMSSPSAIHSVALQHDGKIVAVGPTGDSDVCVVRYNADGSLDTSFSGDGIVTTDIANIMKMGGSTDWVGGAALQTDGKILVAGYSTVYNGDGAYFLTLARYNADGSLDASFSGDGVVAIQGSSANLFGTSIALQADGKIVVAGSADLTNRYTSGRGTLLVRFNNDGSLDHSFSDDGILIDASSTGIQSIAVQTDGKILVTGVGDNGDYHTSYLVIARYNSDGSLDHSFSGDGIATTVIGLNNSGSSIAVQADGKILVVGSSYTDSSNNDFSLIRYNNDGSLDTSFSGDGIVTTDFGSADFGYKVALQVDGKILVSGSSDGSFAIARYNVDGSLDTEFSGDGKVTSDIGTYRNPGTSVALQTDGTILVAGTAFTVVPEDYSKGGHSDFALARYTPDGSLDLTFNAIQRLGGTVAYRENGAPIVLDSSVMVRDTELLATGNYAAATVTLARHGGANTDDTFAASGNMGTLAASSVLTLSSVIIGTVQQLSAGVLSLKFNSHATQELVNETLSSIKYSNTSDAPPASVQIDWTFSDGNTGAQGTGGALSTTASTTVNITAINDAPIGANGKVFFQTNTARTLHASDFGFYDAEDGTALTAVRIDTLPLKGSLRYDGANMVAGLDISAQDLAAGLLTYIPDANASGVNYASFLFKVMDSGGLYDASAKTLTFATNESPTGTVTISGAATQGQVLSAANTLADADGLGAISYQWQSAGINIGGATARTFTLTQAEVGKAVSVLASYTDGFGTAESKTSVATSAVVALANIPITGTSANDSFTSGHGNDSIDGGAGTDIAMYGSSRANFALTKTSTGFTFIDNTGAQGTDILQNVERIKFTDGGIALDVGVDQPGGETQLLLGAVLGKDLLASKQPIIGAVIDLFDQGFTLQQLSGAVMRLPIWVDLTGKASPTNTDIANYLLWRVNGGTLDATTLASAVASLDAQPDINHNQGEFLWHLAASSANQTQVGLLGLAATGLAYGV